MFYLDFLGEGEKNPSPKISLFYNIAAVMFLYLVLKRIMLPTQMTLKDTTGIMETNVDLIIL